MTETDLQETARAAAKYYEQTLPAGQRKELGQFFTGLRLGKLLAHLALDASTRAVLDPMAGHGDLLDAAQEAAIERGVSIDYLDGVEIDAPTAEACRIRLSHMATAGEGPATCIISSDAFDPIAMRELPRRSYDLVITNPPYVRYQSQNTNGGKNDRVRTGLAEIVASVVDDPTLGIWSALIDGYSGLADLSVPAWILAASLVRPKGRLALVIPATWRSRDYADVIRYLLLRCFRLEYVVEDTQPGWFSDALVRTHLIVAQRLTPQETLVPLSARSHLPSLNWIKVAPEASSDSSLVGTAFGNQFPEAQFASWVRNDCRTPVAGLASRSFSLVDEWASLNNRIRPRRWYPCVEDSSENLPLSSTGESLSQAIIPEVFRDLLPIEFCSDTLCTLADSGIQVGQGLRTGCNRFFYVTECEAPNKKTIKVAASSCFEEHRFIAPVTAVQPVLRRQSELHELEERRVPAGRVLDLRHWVLPEDFEIVSKAGESYAAHGEVPPKIMPDELASFVRRAADTFVGGPDSQKRIPQLSAVCTNVRDSRNGQFVPRFWYMLPKFTPRHLPMAFVPRINSGLPWAERNVDPAILIDANFSTFWSSETIWTGHALKALINSKWCRALMEALGTPLGGGALKLEATHLRHLPVPLLSAEAKRGLDEEGKKLTRDSHDVQTRIDEIVMSAVLPHPNSDAHRSQILESVIERARSMSSERQRAA